jgi:hypothetical protein
VLVMPFMRAPSAAVSVTTAIGDAEAARPTSPTDGPASIRIERDKADPFDALLALGASTYKERVATLRVEIQKLEARGIVGKKVYSKARKDFVVPAGA